MHKYPENPVPNVVGGKARGPSELGQDTLGDPSIARLVPGGMLLSIASASRRPPSDISKLVPLHLLLGYQPSADLAAAIKARLPERVAQLTAHRLPGLTLQGGYDELWVSIKDFKLLQQRFGRNKVDDSLLPVIELSALPALPKLMGLRALHQLHPMHIPLFSEENLRKISPNPGPECLNYLVKCKGEIYLSGPQYQRFIEAHPDVIERGRVAESQRKHALRAIVDRPGIVLVNKGLRRGAEDLLPLLFVLGAVGLSLNGNIREQLAGVRRLNLSRPNLELSLYYGILWVNPSNGDRIIKAWNRGPSTTPLSGPIFIEIPVRCRNDQWVSADSLIPNCRAWGGDFRSILLRESEDLPPFCVLADRDGRYWFTRRDSGDIVKRLGRALAGKNLRVPAPIRIEASHRELADTLATVCFVKVGAHLGWELRPFSDSANTLRDDLRVARELIAFAEKSFKADDWPALLQAFQEKAAQKKGLQRRDLQKKTFVPVNKADLERYLKDLIGWLRF